MPSCKLAAQVWAKAGRRQCRLVGSLEGIGLEEEVGSLVWSLAHEAQSPPFHVGLVAVEDAMKLWLPVPEILGPVHEAGHNGTPAAVRRASQHST